ncbi:MAG: DUF2007 domain-containing protein [Reichenbachiella sp.]|uniref:putative signal transducing protein n=1 Tax=Reichenbachiella sp. TaxID=2184521 RepID=UPI003297D27A
MKVVLLTTCDNSIDANLIRIKLEHEGIPCFLNNENFTNLMPHYYNLLGSGVRVMIPDEFSEQAKEVLQISDGRLKCPNCESENITNKNKSFLESVKIFFIGIFLAAPIGNLIVNFTCNDCDTEFKA